MAIDPICGMTVNEATAKSAERDGQTLDWIAYRWLTALNTDAAESRANFFWMRRTAR